MKLSSYIKEIPGWFERQNRLDNMLQFVGASYLEKSEGDKYRTPTFGIDTLANLWVKQYVQNRAQLINDIFTIANTVAEIRGPILHIRNEVFRRGIEWYPKFAVKCKKCNIEYDEPVTKCQKCDSEDLTKPDEEQKQGLQKFFPDCNIFDQSMKEVLMQIEFDMNSIDESFLYLSKEYYDTGDGEVRSKVIEIRRMNPAYMELDIDRRGLPKNKHWVCLIHRNKVVEASGDPTIEEDDPVCEECGHKLSPAMYVYRFRGENRYLLDSEICRSSKFEINEVGGFSPILTIFEKALTLVGMDKTAFRYFFERKVPASMLMIYTDDVEGLRREREKIKMETARDPDYVPMIGVSAKAGNRGRADLIRLFHTFAEMDYLPIKNEIRERIASLWGVTPIWQSSVEAIGGMSSQSMQLVVTSRVVEGDQQIFNEKFFPFILEAFGITDWGLRLRNPEEKAEATRIQFSQQRISAANMLHAMGFDVKLKPGIKSIDGVDFEVSGEAQEMGGGMFGGPPMGGEGGEEEGGFQFMEKAWAPQLNKAGYFIESVESVNIAPAGSTRVLFKSNGDLFQAEFTTKGKLMNVSKAPAYTPGMHRHEGYPTDHPSDMPHDTLSRRRKNEDDLLDKEEQLED